MLVSLSIRNVVLIDKLELAFGEGLCVLTGETGAGKSILLDALGLALGDRAETRLLRPGSAQAVVSAAFQIGADSPAHAILDELGLDELGLADGESQLILRRVLGGDGRSKAFVNDQPASVGLLRRLAEPLLEIQGQFEQRGLLDAGTHRALLDAFAGLSDQVAAVAGCWRVWQSAIAAMQEAEGVLAQARRDEDYLRHALEELDRMQPGSGEEAALAERRALLMNAERVVEAMNAAYAELSGGGDHAGVETALGAARRHLERVVDKTGGRLGPVLAALARADAEVTEALTELNSVSGELDLEGEDLEAIEERYFGLLDLARKHGCGCDDLVPLRDDLAARLAAIDDGGTSLAALALEAERARDAYAAAAFSLSAARQAAAVELAAIIAEELPPLKLERARFQARVERLDENAWSSAGMDRVTFLIATNPGAEPGPLGKVASGGELARCLLALKVAMARSAPEQTLVFDEVDSGVGGATAHAVGERLERLAVDRQVLVVTHSPQVAARGRQHLRVVKQPQGETTSTEVSQLDSDQRRDEIARMLSGAEVTKEARAAALRLMGAA